MVILTAGFAVSACSSSKKKEIQSKSNFSTTESKRVSLLDIPKEIIDGVGDALTPNKETAHTSDKTKFSSKEFGVAGSPRITTGKKVRKGGGRYQVGKPYTVRGRKYYPKEDPDYKAAGMASWYGPNFHGRLTANGEVYDQYALSAAHPTLPLPSYAKVTNLENGSSVVVRVNDRGPFSRKRIIDLSARAAELLGYTKQGVAKVKVEYAGKARLDGLDEEQLIATYKPGTLSPTLVAQNNTSQVVASIPANPTQVSANGLSQGFLPPIPLSRPNSGIFQGLTPPSLVSSYMDNSVVSSNTSKALSKFYANATATNDSLVRLHFGPFETTSAYSNAEDILSAYGFPSLRIDKNSKSTLVLTTAIEDRKRVHALAEKSGIASISLY